MRRRATAVPTNFFPKDSSVPYPHSVTNRAKKATPQGRPVSARGNAIPPENPTGRLVITSTSGGVNGGSQVTHWCPDAVRANVLEWTCPGCGAVFYWSLVEKQWFPVVTAA